MRRAAALALPLVLSLQACAGDAGPSGLDGDDSPPPPSLSLERVVTGLSAPTYLAAPHGDDRLFVLERRGRVRIVEDGELLPDPFLDISPAVEDGGHEQGLLGMAFDPGFTFAGDPTFYVYYTAEPDGDTRVVRYRIADADSYRANPTTVDTILRVEQPAANHNGGMLAFGPDGMLYVSLGDGGGANDQFGNGQDSTTVLGGILRLDVDADHPHVPLDNPFVGRRGDDRLWAYGLRNPWRFAFDALSGTLFIADVGQSDREEVNAVRAAAGGVNYGWSIMEGTSCFQPPDGCDPSGLTLPVLDYGHDEGCSVTGGFVYRGSSIPGASGRYFFSDFCTGFVRSFELSRGEAVDVITHDVESPGRVTSFGEGGKDELYLLTVDGSVWRLVEA